MRQEKGRNKRNYPHLVFLLLFGLKTFQTRQRCTTTSPCGGGRGRSVWKEQCWGPWGQWFQHDPAAHLEGSICFFSPQLPAPTSVTYHQTYPKPCRATPKLSHLYFQTNKWKFMVLTQTILRYFYKTFKVGKYSVLFIQQLLSTCCASHTVLGAMKIKIKPPLPWRSSLNLLGVTDI